jgi:uncharacterized membrane protein YdjX (TVP38/TMEM64 family)
MSPRTAKLVAAVLVLAALAIGAYFLPLGAWALELVDYVRGAGALGVAVYGAAYVMATVLLLPGSLFTIGAGFVWGVGGGFLLVWPAATLGALAAFGVARSVARGWVEARVADSPRLRAVDDAVGERSFQVIALLRLSPLVPFNLLNYVLGISRARPGTYVLATAVAIVPGVLFYTYLGTLVTSAAELASGERPDAGAIGSVLFWGGLVATGAVTILISRVARKQLARKTDITDS